MKRSLMGISFIVAMAVLLSACAPGLALKSTAGALANSAANVITAPSVKSSASLHTDVAGLESTLEQVYQQVSPSVVNIQVTSQVQTTSESSPFGFSFPGQQGNGGSQIEQGLGSGFVWDKNGIIVTNNHVIDGATKISVTFSDGYSVPGEVIGKDVNSDLAVVKVSVAADRLQPVALADSSAVKVGQLAIAIGNPFGLSGTMTMGIISALSRSLPVSSNSTSTASYTIPDVIQTDAPINPGNSGGVLLNEQGEVVGVTAAIESPVQASVGIGYAIPANIVKKVVPTLIEKGKIEYSWLGISGTSLTHDLNKLMNLKDDQRGVLVATVASGGPADNAGLKASTNQQTVGGQQVATGGDVITAIDGQAVNDFDTLVSYLVTNTHPGQKVTLTVLRAGKEQRVDVTLSARPADDQVTAALPETNNQNNGNSAPFGQSQGQASGQVYLGIRGVDLNAEVNNAMDLSQGQQGVLVVAVTKNSPADKAGLKAGDQSVQINGSEIAIGGDVITAIDGKAINGMSELKSIIQQYPAGHEVTLSLLRQGKTVEVKVALATSPANP